MSDTGKENSHSLGAVKCSPEIIRRWAAKDAWHPYEALALAFGLDPEEEIPSNSLTPPQSLFAKIESDIESGLLQQSEPPSILIAWCLAVNVEFHRSILDAIYKADGSDESRRVNRATQQLRQRFVSIRKRNILIKNWSRAPYWSIAQGIALMHNLDPDEHVAHTSYGNTYISKHDGADRILRQAWKAVEHGDVREEMSPIDFLLWAPGIGIDIDQAWPKACEKPQMLRGDIGLYAGGFTEIDLEYDGKLKGHMNSVVQETKNLSTKEQTSVLKLVIGMAVAGYRYNPKAGRNDATKEIADDLARLGIPLDRDTILKWLREGAEHLPSDLDNE